MNNIRGIRNGLKLNKRKRELLGETLGFPRKSQAALEYMMIIGLVLIILTPIVSSVYQQISVISRSRHAVWNNAVKQNF